MKQLDLYITEKLKLNKDSKYLDPVTDEEAVENGIYQKVYNLLKKYVKDLDEWKYYPYYNLKNKGERYQGNDTNLLFHFVYSFPYQLESKKIQELLEKEIVEIKTKSNKQVFNGIVRVLPNKQQIIFYFNQ